MDVPEAVRRLACGKGGLPAYVYDLDGLGRHVAAIRGALPDGVELFYAVKANPDVRVLGVLAGLVDGFEVASAGELAHVRGLLPEARLALGGPGKTAAELALAVRLGVERVHVESHGQLRLLAAVAERPVDVLLRVNLAAALEGASLTMGGRATPFGMDEVTLDGCLSILAASPGIRLRGLHAHLASGLDAPSLLDAAGQVVAFARSWAESPAEINLGGGMAVDYRSPDARFDWPALGRGLAALRRPGEILRVEPGRAVTAYCGWYVTRVIDVKRTHGAAFAIVEGGTHHLRTPAARGHDQPLAVLPVDRWPWPWARPEVADGPVTFAGQLCTPKDVLATGVRAGRVRAGDVVAFGLAGAYAWNISHRDFLMHPPPSFHYSGG